MHPGLTIVAHAPPKPLLVYDGDCNFCMRWIKRWQRTTGDAVAYAPLQEAATSFPEIPRASFESEVKLIAPDGRVSGGAAAVFRSLNLGAHPGVFARFGLWLYERAPGFAPIAEFCYRCVARNRTFFSALTRWM